MDHLFPKGTPLGEIFDKVKERLKNDGGKYTSKRIYNIFKSAPKNYPGEVIKSMSRIKRNQALDCGCCYKLSAPAMDMIVAEVASTRVTLDEIKKKLKEGASASEIIDMMDRENAVLYTVQYGIKEIIEHDFKSNVDTYGPTMKLYALLMRKVAGLNSKNGDFDHIAGMEASINKTIEENENNKEAAE